VSEEDDPKRESLALTEAPPMSSAVPAAAAARDLSYSSATAAERIAKFKEPRVASLTMALRRARVEGAERSAAVSDLRSAEIARLEILQEELRPVLSQVPSDCDLFDVGVAPGDRPRLFIDQIGFVEMDRDRRAYRFVQDTRHGRVTIAETENLEAIVEAVTAYIAHRLVERERALAVDYASGGGAAVLAAKAATEKAGSVEIQLGSHSPSAPLWLRFLPAFLLLVEALGAAVFLAMLATLGVWLYQTHIAH
jgi:hypothetical protein